MKNLGTCDIDQTLNALQQAIENKKMQRQIPRSQNTSPMVSHLFSEMLSRVGGSYGQLAVILEKGGVLSQNFIKKLQQNVEENPWEALRKIAMFSFGIGMFFSLRHKKPSKGDQE